MSDYELIISFREFYGMFQAQYINYISVLFAFLIAAYMVAAKLQPAMVVVVVALFSAFALDSIIVLNFINSDVGELQHVMHARMLEGQTDLSWLNAARASPGPSLTIFAVLRHITIIGGYVGALIFFFHQRHVGRAQLQETTP